MSLYVQLAAIAAAVWVLRTALDRWSEVRLREVEVANRRVDLEFEQFETIKEHHKASRGARLAGLPMGVNFRRNPDELS